MKLLTVVAATSQQGQSIIQAVLSDPQLRTEYTIRGTTRSPDSVLAQNLIQKYNSKNGGCLELVTADVTDPSSLKHAFTGAAVVFATSITVYDGHTYSHEVSHGHALADAAVAAGVPEAYIRSLEPVIKSAFVAPGSFMSNFGDLMAPRPVHGLHGDGVYALATPVRAETRLPLIDTRADFGKWVAAVLADLDGYEGKTLCCATGLYSFAEIVEVMDRVSGKKVVYRQVPEEVWKGFLPELMRDHIADMLRYFQEFGYYGDGTKEKVELGAAQARGRLTTLEEYLEAHPLRLK
ncbi:uncharacterized protein APUU_80290S [Aspergillus puulaauensis]|uniref:NmrA-like domain-containing protein n=1 Tax=Aspergillus puulaauensis TaxID=1220207 RepID=A0A7R7XYT4_9EURO|nr:uncharacterized protein APUU_80290S [Aspergillus puulaauensis]BCS29987.1 hypothetical protein APUU_80290S [Aspergillus puulaauensis]